MPANLAIDYFPTAFSSQGPQLKGLNAANEGFLRAYVRHAEVDRLVAHTRNGSEFESFAALAKQLRPGVPALRTSPGRNASLAEVGALLHPFPGFGPLAWLRRPAGSGAYSLLGITHTTATHAVMDSIGNLLVAPIEPWDAVVCTSLAVRATYESVLAQWQDYLQHRLGTQRFPLPQLPVIPLGVDCDRLGATRDEPQMRAAIRGGMKIEEGAIVAFWMGRFTHLAKAHPLPSYLALQALAKRIDRKVVFLQAGWFASDDDRRAYADAAARFSPDVRHIFVDGRDPRVRHDVWKAADIFISLSDNLQETFGLTPIEGMAAGLPVVVTDWDGYRDTVRDGIDGFRIPTRMPAAGTGADLGFQFASGALGYDHYCGATSQMVSVDLPRCVEALTALATDESLRRRMGDAGRQRARDTYDWRHVIAQYQALAQDLGGRRAAAVSAGESKAGGLPLRDDPFRVFASYPTAVLEAGTRLWPGSTAASQLPVLYGHPLNAVGVRWRLPQEQAGKILDLVGRQPGLAAGALASTGPDGQVLVARTVAWLLKMGLLADSAPRT